MKKKILRVFPERTRYTPDDALVRVGQPALWDPVGGIEEVHVSCAFTWLKRRSEALRRMYEGIYDCPVRTGGPAYLDRAEDFEPGVYVNDEILFFSRGCPKSCPWCIVPAIEGNTIVELEPRGPGNVVQDNNILAASRAHFSKAVDFLKDRKAIIFAGGLDPDLLTDWHVELIRGLHIRYLWLACDTDASIPSAVKAIVKLRAAGFSKSKVRCYCLIGFRGTLEQNENRVRTVHEAGADPFALLYVDYREENTRRVMTPEWRKLQKKWSRPGFYNRAVEWDGRTHR